jgi:hypothetical protein
VNWHSPRKVLLLVGVICALVFIAGMGAAWLNRDNSICSDRKAPVAQRAGVLGQVVYQCHNGQIVTLNN